MRKSEMRRIFADLKLGLLAEIGKVRLELQDGAHDALGREREEGKLEGLQLALDKVNKAEP